MATDAGHRVFHKNGKSDWIRVDQSTPGNSWIYLGTFEFDNSHLQGVLVNNRANGFVIADAVKLIYQAP
jgi:hypothetical protein